MNRSLGVQDGVQPEILHNNTKIVTPVLNLLRQIQADISLALDFSQALKIWELQLGNDLLNYTKPTALDNSVQVEQTNAVYIICRGRARLVSFDANQQREVPTLMLEAREIFGADDLFCNQTILTRAIAASSSQVAQISIANLKPRLEQVPSLQDDLRQQTIERQRLILCKTSTKVRAKRQLNEAAGFTLRYDQRNITRSKTFPLRSKLSKLPRISQPSYITYLLKSTNLQPVNKINK